MKIERINTYQDRRFSQRVLNQHGCFLVDEEPYEVEIIAEREAVIRGKDAEKFIAVIEEFRFYTPHITTFYDSRHAIVLEYPSVSFIKIQIADIQPSQFFVDEDKIAAIRSFIRSEEDIVVQVIRSGNRYISTDGHTRLYYAMTMGWTEVYAVEEISNNYIFRFAEEAIKRNIRSPYDLQILSHADYEIQWNQFCDNFFTEMEYE